MSWTIDHLAPLLVAGLIIGAVTGLTIAGTGLASSNEDTVSYGTGLGLISASWAWMLWIGYRLGIRAKTAQHIRRLSEDMQDVKIFLMEQDETVRHLRRER